MKMKKIPIIGAIPPLKCQPITWTNADFFPIGPQGTNFSETLNTIQ